MTGLADKILAIHDAFDAVRLPHAFGGALALAWCTERARGTIDIDVNIFVVTWRGSERRRDPRAGWSSSAVVGRNADRCLLEHQRVPRAARRTRAPGTVRG